MYTLICATNRPENKTLGVLYTYKSLLEAKGEKVTVLEMGELPKDFVVNDSYGNRSATVEKIIEEKLKPSQKLVVVAPEYNGSYPGIFKAFIDAIHPREFHGKKAALVGVASGRAGNLRGMDHLTDVFHHLQVEVLSTKVPISRLEELIDEKHLIKDQGTLKDLENQIERFRKF